MAKSPNLPFEIWYGLTVHIHFWIYKPNFSKLCLSVKFTANYAKFAQFTPKYPAPFINTLCFRYLPQQEILSNSSKLCKFHVACPHSPRITQNSHQLLTHYTLCFRHLPRQRTLRNSSELCKFCAVCPHGPRIMRNSHKLLIYYYVSDA